MFEKKLFLLAVCISLPSLFTANGGMDLLDPSSVKKFLPAEFHSYVDHNIDAMKQVVSANGGASAVTPAAPAAAPVPTQAIGGFGAMIQTNTPLSSINMPMGPMSPITQNFPAPSAGPSPAYNPYMAAAPAHGHNHAHNLPLMNSQAPVAPAPVVHTPIPSANAGAVQNPFTPSVNVAAAAAPTNFVLQANLNANPVFHPPQESTVPSLPPIEGQHWYQYELVDENVNALDYLN